MNGLLASGKFFQRPCKRRRQHVGQLWWPKGRGGGGVSLSCRFIRHLICISAYLSGFKNATAAVSNRNTINIPIVFSGTAEDVQTADRVWRLNEPRDIAESRRSRGHQSRGAQH